MRLRAKQNLILSERQELTEGKLYTGTMIKEPDDEFYFHCFNDQEGWRTYDISFFEPKEVADGE